MLVEKCSQRSTHQEPYRTPAICSIDGQFLVKKCNPNQSISIKQKWLKIEVEQSCFVWNFGALFSLLKTFQIICIKRVLYCFSSRCWFIVQQLPVLRVPKSGALKAQTFKLNFQVKDLLQFISASFSESFQVLKFTSRLVVHRVVRANQKVVYSVFYSAFYSVLYYSVKRATCWFEKHPRRCEKMLF